MQKMSPELPEDEALFRLRVLIEFDSVYNTYVARCLETGSVATASDSGLVEEMIKELLLDEVVYALETNNLKNLFSSPAPIDVWMKFRAAQRGAVPVKPMQKSVRARNIEEVPAEIEIARSA